MFPEALKFNGLLRNHLRALEKARGTPATLRQILKMPEGAPVKKARGKSLMSPAPFAMLAHPFAETLDEWTRGVPVECGENWTRESIEVALARGAHPTAHLADAIALVYKDVAYQIKAGFTQVVLWDDIKDNLPEQFKLSPVAVIPQAGRRGRIILDLSFPVRRSPEKNNKKGKRRMGAVMQKSVNDTTAPLAPNIPVKELGRVLPRLFEFMYSTPAEEEIRFSKIDLSDGFWRMIVQDHQKWNFCYVMPDPPGAPIRIVVPSALQMGWCESPAYFCAATETARDIIEWLMTTDIKLPAHPMEKFLTPDDSEPRKQTTGLDSMYHCIQVFVDDFVLALVQTPDEALIPQLSRAALIGIHSIFPPPELSGHTGGKDPVSEKKLAKGDARFTVEKVVLGFLLNGRDRTIRLPQEKADKIQLELKKVLRKTKCQLRRFQSIVGKLRHAALILPAAKGLFTPINTALRGNPSMVGLGAKSDVRQALIDLGAIIESLTTRPTHVSEIVSADPEIIGFCDASGAGAGGVWFDAQCNPVVWRMAFPADITKEIASAKNPKGRITNSDLELAALVLHHLVLEQVTPLKRKHVAAFSDNTPTVSWVTKMASHSSSPVAGRLLRGLAMRQRSPTCQATSMFSLTSRPDPSPPLNWPLGCPRQVIRSSLFASLTPSLCIQRQHRGSLSIRTRS
jgi:hypothetical protein